MKLKNMVLAAIPLLSACKDITQPGPPSLSLKDYACGNESCNTFGAELPQNGIRPLRFISLARYPGKQDYYLALTINGCEDGKNQRNNLNLVIVLDVSGSMNSWMETARNCLSSLI